MIDPNATSPRAATLKWGAIALLMLALAIAGLLSWKQYPLSCAYSNSACAAKVMRGHAVIKLPFWEAALAKPLEQRIGIAPPELVEYLNFDNVANGYPDRPRAAKPDAGFLRDVQSAFADIPIEVKRALSSQFAGIYFVDNLGGTGYTGYVVDAASNPAAVYMVLSVSALEKQTANAWATWKENTPFLPNADFRLEAEIETPAHNNRQNSIQYILLHEFGHALAVGNRFHQLWSRDAKAPLSVDKYPFAQLAWSVDRANNKFITVFDASFPQRNKVAYYFGAKLAADQMVATYDKLEHTNFPTLYAVISPTEDFAEAFVSFVHTVILQKPLAIRIYHRGKLAKVYGSCWNEPRCADKRKILEQFLGISGRVPSR